jgi:hypothetical protein
MRRRAINASSLAFVAFATAFMYPAAVSDWVPANIILATSALVPA